jgi:hypothetical protein
VHRPERGNFSKRVF